MDKPEVTAAIIRLCGIQSQQFQFTQELTISLAAIQEVMKDRGDKDFQSDHQMKIQMLKQGALGKQIAQDKATFDRAIQQLMTGLS